MQPIPGPERSILFQMEPDIQKKQRSIEKSITTAIGW